MSQFIEGASQTGRRRARSGIAALLRARQGNVSMVFALGLIPILGVVGLGVDYAVSLSNKAKLDSAADAAALAAVVTAKAYLADNPGQANATQSAITAGTTQATNVFNVNAGNIPLATFTLQAPQLTRTKQTLKSTIVYTANVQNTFGKLFGVSLTTIRNTVTATADIASYLDFYLMVDVSGSMGLPTTADGMTKLASKNFDMYGDYQQGCQFACHFPGYTGWNVAVSNNVQLRSDAVNDAVCSLLQRAGTPAIPNQYRVGIYPFVNQLATLASLTSNMTTLNTAAQCGSSPRRAFTNLLDTGTTQLYAGSDPSTGTGAGGTHFEAAFPTMQAQVASFGDGSSASAPKPYVFLVTDGMQNSQHYFTWAGGYAYPGNPSTFSGYGNAWWDGSQPAQIDPSQCAALKSAGATISILYIPYNQISFVDKGGGIAWENKRVNGFSGTLATPLQACASTGFFYTANSPADITAALNAMFNQALQVAHITR